MTDLMTPVPKVFTTATFLGRFTTPEYTKILQTAVTNLAAGDSQIARWMDQARVAVGGIDLTNPDTCAAKAMFITTGLLTQARADAIFSVDVIDSAPFAQPWRSTVVQSWQPIAALPTTSTPHQHP